jgi:hypothetical protein
VEAADPAPCCPLGERRQECRPHPVALPFVDHRDRHLGRFEVILEAHVAGDPDWRAGRGRERDQRFVMPVVDVEKPGQLARQLGAGGEEPLVAGLLAQMSQRECDRPAIGRVELADRDLTAHR